MADVGPGLYSISAGDTGWERWQAINSDAASLAFDPQADIGSDEEEEEDYEAPDEGESTKKRRPKPPRGASKKAKLAPKDVAERTGKPTKTVKKTTSTAKKPAAKKRAPKGKSAKK